MARTPSVEPGSHQEAHFPGVPVAIARHVRLFAGTLVLVLLALGAPGSPLFVSANWLWFTAFVGANLFQSSLTGFCPLVNVLRALGVKSAPAVKA